VIGMLGMVEVPATTGDFAMEMPVTENVSNNRGGLQGGLLATLVDVVAGIGAMKGSAERISAATSDMHIHFLSAVTVGPARAEATALRRGKRIIVMQIEVRDVGRDVLCAVATATFSLLRLRPDQVDMRDVETPG
jgi:uncharacterized protein (TIGR00369 family)